MSFINTPDDLDDLLTEDLTWRVKEISALKSLIARSTEGVAKKAALRASLPLLYAHWEGYIKNASDRYLTFVYGRRPSALSLKPALAYAFLEPQFKGLGGGSSSFTPQNAIAFAAMAQRVSTRANPNVMVNTKSNLRYDVLKDIVSRLALDDFLDIVSESTVDDLLCDKRNHIAHGQSVPLTVENFEHLRLEFTGLMRSYKERLVTAASNREYMA